MAVEPPDFNRNVHCLLGLPFDAIPIATATSAVRKAIAKRKQLFVSTPNLNFLIACTTDAQFRDSVIHSELSLADGMPIVWMARLLGVPIAERVAGSSLFETLRNAFIRTDETPIQVYFFGGPDGVAKQACERINSPEAGQHRPSMQCAGYASPGFGSIEVMSTEPILEHINNSGADFIVVSLGARKGQAWIELNRHKFKAPVISHLGAVVNMVAGTVLRAPVWMQRTGLEWIWRIKEEPSLWRRYRDDGLALIRLLLSRVLPSLLYTQFKLRKASKTEPPSLSIAMHDNVMQLVLQGSWTAQTLEPLRLAFRSGIEDRHHIELDLAAVTYTDSAFWGQLLLLYGYQEQIGRSLNITAASKTVHKQSYFSCVEFLLAKAK